MRLVPLLLAVVLAAAAPAPRAVVSVAYAASLTQTMEGPVAHGFRRTTGYGFEGEGKGSKALANLIKAGLRAPDVFLSADASLYPGLRVFGSADLVIGYTGASRFAKQLDAAAAGRIPLARVLREQGLRVGRTDPALDPKGEKTLAALRALGVAPSDDVFPEEDLLARVQTGQADCGFFYTTETRAAGLRTIALPNGIGARPGIAVAYAIEALPHAPHPAAARAFVEYVLHGDGRALLEAAGIRYK